MNEAPETDALMKQYEGLILPRGFHEESMMQRIFRQRVEKIERERDELRTAIRKMRDAKGWYHTQFAVEELFKLLPENAKTSHTDADFDSGDNDPYVEQQ